MSEPNEWIMASGDPVVVRGELTGEFQIKGVWYENCHDCSGTGLWLDDERVCPACAGKGFYKSAKQ